MIKNLLFIPFALLLWTNVLHAQQNRGNRPAGPVAPPLPMREVSGVVRDSLDNTLIGATIMLTSKKDTIRTTTNADGVFVLKNVKLATFTVSISSVGFITSVRKYLQNDAVKRIVLEPIVLKSNDHVMGEVKINGTPSITYKTDTVEYRASDYKVRANSTVDELLKKMEGFEVGSDGSVTHQGQAVVKAKLNGKDYAGGDVAQAIKNLPADIVEKIQLVDDYGDAAARTGIKDGDPQKVLNITTRADRSVGNTARLSGQYGHDDRYNVGLFAQRINANQQLGIIGRLQNTVNGVASTGLAGGATNGGGGGSGVGTNAGGNGGTGGTTKSGSPSFNYRDQWGKKIQVIASYAYSFANVNSINVSNGTNFSSRGNEDFTQNSNAQNNRKTHNINFQMEYSIDSANFLQITPNFSYSSANNNSIGQSTYNDFYYKDTIPKVPDFRFYNKYGSSRSASTSPNYGLTVFYQHLFKKPHRNMSLQGTYNYSNNGSDNENPNLTYYYNNVNRDIQADSLYLHYLVNHASDNKTYRLSSTYVEPLSLTSQIEFNGQVRHSTYDNAAVTDSITFTGKSIPVPARNSDYNYSFTETRLTLNYRFNGVKYNISLGASMVPTELSGTKLNSGVGTNISTSRSDLRFIPVFRLGYQWSRTERFTINYSGTNSEPSFQEIQPFTDISNPQHPVVGNPNLKPTFTHSVNLQYNNYIANSKLNFSFGVNASVPRDQIATNNIQILDATFAKNKTFITQTNYVNLNGAYAVVGRYNIAKQLDDRKYNLALNGNVTYGYNVSENNNILYNSTNWRFDERLGPRISPNENIEINPYLGYDVSRSFFTQPGANSTEVKTTSLAVDGKMYFLKTYLITYSASKNYIVGLPNLTTNPFVINAGFEKEFFEKRNLVFTFNVFDLLHQNNFVQQTVNAQSVTNTQSNALSRYFLAGFRLNLQKWSGSPKRNGRDMRRRGDGSFIYE
jgi:hypothetical protein